MTRYEVMRQFATDERTHRNHLVTINVLTEMWVTQGKPVSIELDYAELLAILKTKRSTLFDWLRQLEEFNYIELQRSANQHQKSTVVLKIGNTLNRIALTQVGQHVLKPDCNSPNRIADQGLACTETGQQLPKSDGTYPGQTADGTNDSQEIAIEANQSDFVDKLKSAEPLLVHHNNHLRNNFCIHSKGGNEVNFDEKGVQGRKRKPKKSANRPVCKFTDSTLAELSKFQEALSSETTYRAADLAHYHERLLNWRDKSGDPPERADWLATAKTFLLNDYREGKLVTTVKQLNPHANHNNFRSSGPLVQPAIDDKSRRFGSW